MSICSCSRRIVAFMRTLFSCRTRRFRPQAASRRFRIGGRIVFKRLFMLIVLSAVFLSGYYLGRLPGSPDVFAMARDGYDKAAELGKAIGAAADDENIESLKSFVDKQVNGEASLAAPE